ncbi:MAG: hypothetical protein F6K19_01495 [Cyanothece sp. SIO1E1]|nr:hypothetical protein [Cyanothece sp. SIO1E1]
MACEICGRINCCASFHSIEEQQRHDEIKEPVIERMREVLKAQINKLEASGNEEEYYVKLDEVIEIIEDYY